MVYMKFAAAALILAACSAGLHPRLPGGAGGAGGSLDGIAGGGMGGRPLIACASDADCEGGPCGRARCTAGFCETDRLELLWEIPVPESKPPGGASLLMSDGDRLVWSADGWFFAATREGELLHRTLVADDLDPTWVALVLPGVAILQSPSLIQ